MKEYSAQIRLKEIIDTNPNVGETIDLNEHHPGIFKYNDETQEWEEIQDDENVRIRLEYDETVWEAVNEEAIPTLRRIAQGQSDLHLPKNGTLTDMEMKCGKKLPKKTAISLQYMTKMQNAVISGKL